LRSKMPNLLELSFRNMTTIGRLQEKLAKSQLKDGRDFGPSASSLAITSLLPNAVVSWNENARRRCGLRDSSSRFDEFLRRVQEMGRCFERQIPMNSEFARSLEELGGPRALAHAIDLLLLTAN